MDKLIEIIEKCKNNGTKPWDILGEKYAYYRVLSDTGALNEEELEYLVNFADDKIFEEQVLNVYYGGSQANNLPDEIVDAVNDSDILGNPWWGKCMDWYEGVYDYDFDKIIVDWLAKSESNIDQLFIYGIVNNL